MLNGAVAFNDVHFHYQMRPDNPVLQGARHCSLQAAGRQLSL